MHLFLLSLALLPAHPVPKDNHDRTVVVRLTPEAILVEYRLEMDETTGALELPRSETAAISTRKELHAAIGRYLADVLAGNLVAELDGVQLPLRCTRHSEQFTDHLRCDYRFEAPWRLTAGKRHWFTFRESNWEMDDSSKLALYVTGDGRLSPQVDAPSESLMARTPADRQSGDSERLRVASATFQLAQVESSGLYKPALPPDLVLPSLPEHPEDAASSKPAAGLVAAEDKPKGPTPAEETAESNDAALPPPHNLLTLMLDSRLGLGMLLLAAALFGAAHALTPGHGKTLVAAYLVGERGTLWHALLLGLVTTLTHTSVVIVLAVLLLFFPEANPDKVQSALGLVGGLLIAGLGFWLLLRRLTGQADHIHIGGGHHHHHHGPGHHHHHVHLPTADAGKPVGWRGLIVLGIGGGIVPCWDAILLLGYAVSAQRLWLALPLVLAFSAGLASVLVGLGIGVVCAQRWAGHWWGESQRFEKLARLLPLVSAALVTVLGLWLCYGSVQMPQSH